MTGVRVGERKRKRKREIERDRERDKERDKERDIYKSRYIYIYKERERDRERVWKSKTSERIEGMKQKSDERLKIHDIDMYRIIRVHIPWAVAAAIAAPKRRRARLITESGSLGCRPVHASTRSGAIELPVDGAASDAIVVEICGGI